MFRLTLQLLIALFVAASWPPAVGVAAENWPQWRGPRNDGTSLETGLPTTWSSKENVLWRTPLPGPAGATPVIWGDSIFVTSARDRDLLLLCIGTDGKLLWEKLVSSGDQPVRGDEGNSASPSPVTDGEHVWTFMADGILACYDLLGNEVWKFNLQDRYGKFDIQFGMTSTPILDGDRLYLQLLHSAAALVLALDKATGREIWKQNRPSDATAECEHSYASPFLYRAGKQEFLITHGCDYVVAHRLSDGKELWRCGGMNPKGRYNPTLRFVASPVGVPGLIVVPSAKNGPVLGISPTARGDISEKPQGHLWTRPQNTPDVPSPLVFGGLVYLCRENGVLICMDAKTGEQIYEERTHSQRHRASPVYADGKIYLTARDGVVTVVKAGRKFEVLASNDLGESISSSPAISNGCIYLRTFDALYAIGRQSPGSRADATEPNTEPAGELIFNGRDLTGWVIEGNQETAKYGKKQPIWSVVDGEIHCIGGRYGFIRYDRKLTDFAFSVDFRLAKRTNSGIGLRGTQYSEKKQGSAPSVSGYEIQLLDDGGTAPNDHSSGSLYRYLAPKVNAMKPAGEWNHMEIECRGPHIRVTLNGQVLHDVDQTQHPSLKDKPLSGYLSLQDHGGAVAFRHLKLRDLSTAQAAVPPADTAK